jgi:hypothetical protein
MPIEESNNREVRHNRIVIDSRDRDRAVYPTPSQYEVNLSDDIENVINVKLLVADVPFAARLLPESSSRLFLSMTSGTDVVADVAPGNYSSGADLALALSAALSTSAPGTFHVSYTERLDSLVLRCTSAFSVETDKNVPRILRVLGLGPGAQSLSEPSQDTALATYPHVLRAPHRVCLDTDRYVIMSMSPSAEVLMSANNAANRAFAVIPRDRAALSVRADDPPFEKSYKTPISRLTKVGIKFTDYDGQPYDFQDQDHRIELLVTSILQRKYLF